MSPDLTAKQIEEEKRIYDKKISSQFKDKFTPADFEQTTPLSSQYIQFMRDNQFEHLSFYEKLCEFSLKILPLKPDAAKAKKLQEDIDTCHMQLTPAGSTSFAILFPLALLFIIAPIVYLVSGSLFLIFFIMALAGGLILPLESLPSYFAQNWRMRASNQMVLSIFYIVTYMRHTSNLERAIEFASQHLAPPLSLDLRKVLWDVETHKYDNIQQSLESYLIRWKEYNPEYANSMHVIMSSLYETSEQKRQELLDKSLDLILEETYDKMLHYAHNLQSPITALHMLGIVLPILGLIILPLMVNFIPEVHWIYILLLYNFMLPLGIFILSKTILSKRPSGYGGIEVDSNNPEILKRTKTWSIFGVEMTISPLVFSLFILFVCLFIGFSPFILHAVGFEDVGFGKSVGTYDEKGINLQSPCGKEYCLLGYKISTAELTKGDEIGPFGLGATLLSLFIPLGIALAFGIYYHVKSKNVIEFRNETQKLEEEFTGALFQLGNRLGDGLPAEVAFARVASAMPNSRSGDFFRIISHNIQELGMSVNDAIFNPKSGALVYYPSTLIESSMKILTQSSQKGPKVASNAIENVARYIKEMNRVNERLQDLMAEVISSMKSQVSFLTPIISGIVIGITSMITTILSQLSGQLGKLQSGDLGGAGGQAGAASGLLTLFGDGIPTFFFSMIIGIYVVQIIILLSQLINQIQNGIDVVNEQFLIAGNLLKGAGLYIVIAFIIVLAFNLLAGKILGTVISG